MELKALNLTPEEMFILLCCRQAVKQDAAKDIDSLLGQNLDWTTVEYMIGLHGIAGFALAALAQHAHRTDVPDTLIERLKQQGLKNFLKNHFYVQEFHKLVKACSLGQIRLVPLKGIAFLTSLYAHNTALRSLSDIDILFEKIDIERVEDILVPLGYQTEHMDARAESRAFHSAYGRRVSGFTLLIEAHWDFDYADSPYKIDIADMRQRSREIKTDIGTYYELSIEDTLILNCFHILRHIPKGPDVLLYLKNFCDIALLLKMHGGTIDWECILQRSRHYNVIRPVGMVLLLVRDLLGAKDIPCTVFKALQAEGFQEDFAACAVREYIFNPSKAERKSLPFLMVDIATAVGLREKIKIIIGAPKIFLSLYRARYYERYGRSTPRALAHITWYYSRKAAAAFALWVRAPRKAAQLQKKRVAVNRKTQAAIDWLRG